MTDVKAGPAGRELAIYEEEDRVAIVTLNRPEKLNALSRDLWAAFDACMERALGNPHIRAVVLLGQGRAFSVGADIAGNEDPTALGPWLDIYGRHHVRQCRIWDSNKLFIAGVQGHCLGRGLELALWCDIVLAARDARIGQPEIREAFIVSSVAPWLMNPQAAKLFMLGGESIGPEEAAALGLVARVVDGDIREETLRLARRLAHVPARAAGMVKRMVNEVQESQGLRVQQAAGVTLAAAASAMTPEEKGIAELLRIRHERGFKESIRFRDAPFA